MLAGCYGAATQLGDSCVAWVRGAWVSSSYAWAFLGVQVELDILLVDNSPMWQAYPSHAWSYPLVGFIFGNAKWILVLHGLVG